MTLRFLATGESVKSLSYQFRLGVSTTCQIVKEVCAAIHLVLSLDYLRQPTKVDWEKAAKGFDHLWDFPNCIGALDGKHIRMRCPPNGGSMYINYKGIGKMIQFSSKLLKLTVELFPGFHSITLLAMCDA